MHGPGLEICPVHQMSPLICAFFWLMLSPLLTNAQFTPGVDPPPSPMLAAHRSESIRTIIFNSDEDGSYCGKTITLDRFTKYLLRPNYEADFRECSIDFVSPGRNGVCTEQEEAKTMILDYTDHNMVLQLFGWGDDETRRYFLASFEYQEDKNQNKTSNEICAIGFNLQFQVEKYHQNEPTDIDAVYSTLAVVHVENPFRSGHINHVCGMRYDYRSKTGRVSNVDHSIHLRRAFYTLWYGRKPISSSYNLWTPKSECSVSFEMFPIEKFESRICVYYKPLTALDCTTSWRLTLTDYLQKKELDCNMTSAQEIQVWCWPFEQLHLYVFWELFYPPSGYVEPEEQFHLIVADFYGGAESEYREVIQGDLYLQEDYIKSRYGSLDDESSQHPKDENASSNSTPADDGNDNSTQSGSDDEPFPDFRMFMYALVGLALLAILITCIVCIACRAKRSSKATHGEVICEYDRIRKRETCEQFGSYI